MATNVENPDTEKKSRICFSSRLSLLCAIVALLSSVTMDLSSHINYDFMNGEVTGPHPLAGSIAAISWTISAYAIGMAFFSGIIAFFAAFFLRPRLKNFCISIGALLLAFIALQIYSSTTDRVRNSPARWCAMNLDRLGYEIEKYAKQYNGQLVPAENWCDILVDEEWWKLVYLKCPRANTPKGMSSYALNESLADMHMEDIPSDVVLLFETTPANNPVGGRESITAGHHYGKGCIVLFGDLRLGFVKAEDFNDLRWEP